MLNSASPSFVASLRSVLPARIFGEIQPRHRDEPRGNMRGRGGVLLLPSTTEQIAEIVRRAAAARVGIVPYGGGTGLVGGQVLPNGPAPVILSMERYSRIREVDLDDGVLVTDAGAILADVQGAASDAGRIFPLSMASEGSCQIGGNLATNAGGMQVVRYGTARDLCLGLEAVLPDGTVFDGLRRLRKNNTGYDLKNLLIGSEGSLGVITAAVLKVDIPPGDSMSVLASIGSPADAVDLFRQAKERLGNAVAVFELIRGTGFDFLREVRPEVRLPLPDADWLVLAEFADVTGSDLRGRVEGFMFAEIEAGRIDDAVVAQSMAQQRELRSLREMIPEANRLIGAIASHDISVPISRVSEFIEKGMEVSERFGPLRVNCFGHVGDGNLHFNVFPPHGCGSEELAGLRSRRKAISEYIHELAYRCHGSFSAEHGVGRLKTDELRRYGSPAGVEAMKKIKASLDPLGIMNPGAVLPPPPQE